MKTIWKFPLYTGVDHLGLYGERGIEVPVGTEFIYVAHQHGQLCVWGMVDDEADAEETAYIYIAGTGEPMPAHDMDYIGSSWQDPFVWHVFRIRKTQD